MVENIINSVSENIRQEVLRHLLQQTLKNAPSVADCEKSKAIETEAFQDFLHSRIDAKKFGEIFAETLKMSGILELENLSELRFCLAELGLPDEIIEDLVAHERDHYQAVIKSGFEAVYQLQFVRVDEEEVGFYAGVRVAFDFTKNTEDEVKEAIKRIIAAPQEMSHHDKESLK